MKVHQPIHLFSLFQFYQKLLLPGVCFRRNLFDIKVTTKLLNIATRFLYMKQYLVREVQYIYFLFSTDMKRGS